MENGFTSQFTKTVTAMPRAWRRTCPSAEKSMRISIGTIITQMSRPTGRFTCATCSAPRRATAPGHAWPSATPTAMQATTHAVR